jgi:hypothetical protein
MRVGGQRRAPAALRPGKRPRYHCTGGWMERRACLHGCGKSRPHRDSIPGPSSSHRVAIPTELSEPPFQENIGTKPECGQVASCHNLFNYLSINHRGNRDSSVSVVTRRQAGRPKNYSSNVGTGKSVSRSTKPPHRF